MVLTIDRAPTTAPKPEERPYQPRGAARELMRCRAPEVLLAGPAGTGKSRATLEKLHLAALSYPRMRAAIVRKTRKSLTQAALVTFETKVLPEPSGVKFNHEDQEYRYGNGARVTVSGLDDPEKIKSSEYDMIYVQEATELNEGDWEMLISRLRNGVMPYQQLIADCNPADPNHWLKLRCDAGTCVLLESRHEDNPAVTDEYIAALDRLTGYRYQRLRLGLWVAAEGMYFEEWNPDLHVVDAFPIPPEWPRWLAVDYGFAAPFCCLWFARDPATRRIYVYRELHAAGLRDEQQAKLIALRSKDERIIRRLADPSMFNSRGEADKPSIARVYAANGVPLVKALNNRVAGWQAVRRALACDVDEETGKPTLPRLQVFRQACPNLIRTLPAMVHDPLDPEDLADEVNGQKTDDHGVDALRYAIAGEAQPSPKPQRYVVTSRPTVPVSSNAAEKALITTRARIDALTNRKRN